MEARIIYYNNLDYDKLPTSKKRRLSEPPKVNLDDDTENCLYDTTTNTWKPATTNQYYPPTANNSYSINYSNSSNTSTTKTNYNYQTNNFNPNTNGTSARSTSNNNSYTASAPTRKKATNYKQSNVNGNGNVNNHNDSHPYSNTKSSGNDNATNYQQSSSSNYESYSSGEKSSSSYEDYRSPPINRQPKVYHQPNQKLLLDTLKKYFKFDSFRTNQLESVNASCSGLDTLILMPTGGGKSICYQLPAIISQGLTIVVSPLKSLITDQVDRLRSLNIKTSALFGETTDDEVTEIFFDLKQPQPKHKLLYVTPEKINASGSLMNLFNTLHRSNLLARFVIDEAHCVSMWGSDFRPDYRKLGKLRELFPDVPIMALTATAPPKVRDDILDQLGMNKASSRVFIQSFNRPNLKFEVRIKSKGCLTEICNMIRASYTRQCGIIYCLSRNDCESVSETLREQGITSAPYHAGLPDEQRKRVFNAWSRGVFQVVCATIAFGMGIDKSDVRFVIHYSMPKSVEGYYQEAGRAGRDGKFAACILYFSKSDVYRMRSMLSKTGFGRKAEDKKRDVGNLQHMIDYVDNRTECRRSILLRYLGEEFDSRNCIDHITTACDNCLAKRN